MLGIKFDFGFTIVYSTITLVTSFYFIHRQIRAIEKYFEQVDENNFFNKKFIKTLNELEKKIDLKLDKRTDTIDMTIWPPPPPWPEDCNLCKRIKNLGTYNLCSKCLSKKE